MSSGNATLFLSTVIIWGTTWFVILGQLGSVHPVVSVGWRFLAAGSLMAAICWLRGISLRLPSLIHRLCLLQGLTLFGINYCLFYTASSLWTTGLISVVFSTMVFWNAIGARLFLARPLDRRALVGGAIGVSGLLLLFVGEVSALSLSNETALALTLCLLATLCASTGNIISAKTQALGFSVWSTTAFGMLYGSIAVLGGAIAAGIPLRFDWSLIYVSSFLYLVVFGSVIAFACYLTLLGRIGPGRVAYTTVAFPVVAMIMSVGFEGFQPDAWSALSVAVVLVGNWIALSNAKQKPPCTHHRR